MSKKEYPLDLQIQALQDLFSEVSKRLIESAFDPLELARSASIIFNSFTCLSKDGQERLLEIGLFRNAQKLNQARGPFDRSSFSGQIHRLHALLDDVFLHMATMGADDTNAGRIRAVQVDRICAYLESRDDGGRNVAVDRLIDVVAESIRLAEASLSR